MENITFETLPKAVEILFGEVASIKNLLLTQAGNAHTEEPDENLLIDAAGQVVHLSIPTMYAKVRNREIPFYKKGKRLYFSKRELQEWIRSGRNKTIGEAKQEAETYLTKKKKGANS